MQPLRILVVDDEEAVREVVARRLRQAGHRVDMAGDGTEACLAFEQGGFDVVITDLNMPRMGGMELVRRIKGTSALTVTIVLTGCGTLDSAVGLLRQGCDDYLLKPIENLDIVAHSVERSLVRRDALLMAASARKLGEAKDNILSLVVNELDLRLAEVREHVDKIARAEDAIACRRTAETMRAQLTELSAVVADIRRASQAVREHSKDLGPGLPGLGRSVDGRPGSGN